MQRFAKDVVQSFEPLYFSDPLGYIEDKDIHARRVLRPEPSIIVLNAHSKLRLRRHKSAQALAAAKRLHRGLVVSLDHERLVKLGEPHLNVLHPQKCSKVAEDRGTMDGKSKAA